ncbi:hypothetical protein [Solemya velum gill symbiont]|uniref:hypothetical protein n=2 Tax=Solemya velum gill symbiont TaxID=2340 RepID=UPI001182D53D|nr:hypothetical protein [Solemya velum gill symbiont]
MKMSNLVFRFVTAIVVLCLSLQATAATGLQCNHEMNTDEQMQLSAHPCHQDMASSDTDKQQPVADCENCQSCLFLSALGLLEMEAAALQTSSSIHSSLGNTHYYQFNPELYHRPPSSITLS